MNHPVLVSILLGAAVLVMLACSLALLVMRGSMARLHYLGPAALLPPVFIAAAVITEEGLSQAGLKAIMVAILLLLQAPVLAHVLGRAISSRAGKGPANESR